MQLRRVARQVRQRLDEELIGQHMYTKSTLDNGLRVVTADIPQARSVSTAIFVGAGSRYEEKRISGISHFLEHMFFKGTRNRRTAKEISEAIEGVGGIINAEAGKEVTVFWTKVARPHFSLALDVLGDILLNSTFEPPEIEKERAVIIEELSMLMDSPQEWVDVLLDEVMWGDQPLGWDIGGTRESVSAITREDMMRYLEGHYAPENAVVSIAGAVDHEAVVAELAALLGRWDRRLVAASYPEVALPSSRLHRAKLQSKKTEQAHFCLGLPGLSYVDPDRFTLDLLNVILGEGMSSRLFQEIREKRGLAYDVHSYVNHYRDVGSSIVYAGVDPRRIDPAIAAVLEELAKLKMPIPALELAKAKEFWKGRMLLRLEDTRSIAAWMGGQELLLGRIMDVDEVVSIIDAISGEHLQQVAQRLFGPEHLNLAVIGPFNSEARFAKKISA